MGVLQGKTSRIEPTSWAALALMDLGAAPEDDAIVAGALARIEGWQRPDGLLSELPGSLPTSRSTASPPSRFSARLPRGAATRGTTGKSWTLFLRES